MRVSDEYKPFYKQLMLDFRNAPPSSKNELRIQMQILKYRVSQGEKLFPTKNQLEKAWEILHKEGVVGETREEKAEVREQKESLYLEAKVFKNNRRVFIAKEDSFIFDSKLNKIRKYRKGQFLPKKAYQDYYEE